MYSRYFLKKAFPKRKTSWEIPKKLRNSTRYAHNIPAWQGAICNPDFVQTHYVVYLKCTDSESVIDDLILARHTHKEKTDKEDFISCQVSAPALVAEQLLDLLWNSVLQTEVILDYSNDGRIRLGLTVSCQEEDQSRLRKMLQIIHQILPFPASFTNLLPTLLAKTWHEHKIAHALPLDTEYTPPYFRYRQNSLSIGMPYHGHYSEDDAILGTELPGIHQAILDNDQTQVQRLLLKNPELANKKDPWGLKAYMLAKALGSTSSYPIFVETRVQYCYPKSAGDKRVHQADLLLLEKWKTSTPFDDQAIHKANIQFQNIKKMYMEHSYKSWPVRSSLHQACIDGNQMKVETLLDIHPERLDEQDPRGYTPLLLASANGHAELVRFLLQKGACSNSCVHKTLFGQVSVLRLIDNAATPEVLQAILKVSHSQKELEEKLIDSIERNDVRMTQFLAHYLQVACNFKGLSALDLALRLNRIDIVKILLMHHQKPLPSGPYDQDLRAYIQSKLRNGPPLDPFISDISPEIIPLIEAHNKNVQTQSRKMRARVSLRREFMNDRELISEFSSDSLQIESVLKRVGELSSEEIMQIKNLFFDNFEIISGNTEKKQHEYLASALADSVEKPGYINLYYDKSKTLIAFFTFETFTLHQAEIFHAKLAANRNEAEYASQKLLKLSFRVVHALQKNRENRPVFVYAKAIAPGLGLAAILPGPHTEYYPKYTKNIGYSFVQDIVKHTGEQMNQGIIPAKLRVKERSLYRNASTSFFAEETAAAEKNALAICYEVTEKICRDYLKNFRVHGIDEHCMEHFGKIWRDFSEKTVDVPAYVHPRL